MIKLKFSKLNWGRRYTYFKSVIFDEKKLEQGGLNFRLSNSLPIPESGPIFTRN